jgi:3-deoxy-D-manno-octulosonic-acid transferase
MKKSDKKRIWLQAVSVGEVKAVGSLIDRFIADGRFEIVLTATSSTGYTLAKELYGNKILFVGLFPWDFCIFSMLAWKRIWPDVAILMESELWPEHMHQARVRHVPVYLVNARLSDKSFARYSKFKALSRAIFSQITKILASSEGDFSRFIALGVDERKLSVSGNIKFDCALPQIDPFSKNKLKIELGFSEKSSILLGSSTWLGEEEWLIKCFDAIRKKAEQDWRLLLVPRHAERREEIVFCLKKSKFSWHQRSCGPVSKQIDICFADTTGELAQLTDISDLVFIGKSLLGNSGGQSPLDAAAYGVPMVYGDSMTNFRAICQSLESAGGAVKAGDTASAQDALVELALNEHKRAHLSKILSGWYAKNRGATEHTYRAIVEDFFDAK